MDAAAPPLPDNTVQFIPPAVYTYWWQMTEECAALSGPLSRLTWYVVPGAHRVTDGEGSGSAYWSRSGNRVVLAGTVQLDGPIVRHEMLHALLQASGHPHGQFLRQCAGTVVCYPDCARDAGPAQNIDWTAPRVTANALDISVSVEPERPNSMTHGGFFFVTVKARNPAPHPVMVTLPQKIGAVWETFGVRFSSNGHSYQEGGVTYDPLAGYFESGETKRHIFDLRIDAQGITGELQTGRYEVSGSYIGRWVPGPTIVLEP